MTTLFDELLAWLELLVPTEFSELVVSFLSSDEINKLPKAPDLIDRGTFLQYVQQWRKLDSLRDYLYQKYPERFVQKEEKQRKRRISFTNRRTEIDDMTSLSSDSLFKYFLVQGPSGYGKSELLTELKELFKNGWHCAHTVITKNTSLINVAESLAQGLGVKIESNNATPGLQLSGALKLFYGDKCKEYRGLVLLIDFDKDPPTEILGQVLNEFLPEIENNLRKHECFHNGQMHFRVVLAGRYLAITKEVKTTNLPLNIRSLSPFTYSVVKSTIDKDLSSTTADERQKLSAHMIFLTGGHPGCIADILELFRYQPIPVDDFMTLRAADIRMIIRVATDTVREELPKGEGNFTSALDALMVFRHVNYFVLDWLRTKNKLEHFRDTFDFEDKLTEGYFFTRNQYLLQDNVVRRLMTTYMRAYNSEFYIDSCRQAMEICEGYLLGQDIQSPPQWIIEYLFQWLQKQSVNQIDTCDSREKLRAEFFTSVLPYAMDLYLKRHSNLTKEKCREDQQAIISELEQPHQWEFEFAVNYFLRVDSYDGSQCVNLEHKIKELLETKLKEIQ